MSLSRIFRDDFFNPTFEGFLDFPQSRRGQSAALTAANNQQDQLLQAQQMMKLDVSETPTEFKVQADLPGYDKQNINVNFEDGMLRITAERKEERDEENEKYHVVERRYGSSTRSLRLPKTADGDNIVAKHDNGVLRITIPKKVEESKKSQIPVH